MLIFKAVLLCITVYLVCYFAGELVCSGKKMPFGMKTATGLMLLWAAFYIVAVPIILLQPDTEGFTVKLREAELYGANTLTKIYLLLVVILFFAGLTVWSVGLVKRKGKTVRTAMSPMERNEIMLLGLFLGLLFFQLIKAVFFAYNDGDDSYYVSVAQIMGNGENSMYMKNPYNGYPTELQTRYALAPLPIWVGFLSRVFTLNASVISHSCLPLILITVTYAIYNAIAELLFENNRLKRYMFLSLMAIFVMFSHYSYMSAEVFLLTRSRQGKEALANIIIPFLFYIMIDICKKDKINIEVKSYITIIFISLSASLCSVFGNVLVGIMLFGLFVYSFYRRAYWLDKLLIASLAVPPVCVLALYYLV